MTNEQIQEIQLQYSILRAMASNYAAGHRWDHLDGEAVTKAADGIDAMLAEREADKKRLAELKGTLNLASASYAGERARADALQADLNKAESMITQYSNALSQAANDKVQWVVMETGFRQRIAELEKYTKNRDEENQGLMLTVGRLRTEREQTRTLTVKLPEPLMPMDNGRGELFMTPDNLEQGGYLNRDDVLRALRKACVAAGIKLDVGE